MSDQKFTVAKRQDAFGRHHYEVYGPSGETECVCTSKIQAHMIADAMENYSPIFDAAEAFMKSINWDDSGPTFYADGGCPDCTYGTVPNHRNTGKCGFHSLRSALRKARGKE